MPDWTIALLPGLRRSAITGCFWAALLSTVAGSVSAQASFLPQHAPTDTLRLSYLGTAGWQITDGRTVVLVDPYLTRLGRAFFQNSWTLTRDGVPLALLGDSVIVPDTAAIRARIERADYVLVGHSHYDHLLDVPYIALRTGATVIGTESTRNIAQAHGVADSQLIAVRGGEDYEFGGFSLRVITSLHTALAGKHFFDSRVASRTLRPPLRIRDYPEGGTLAFLVRMAGCEVYLAGSMNFIEREVMDVHPDVAIIGSTARRREVFDYTGRLLRALAQPPVILPNHWDDETLPFTDPNATGRGTKVTGGEAIRRALDAFAAEVHQASPRSRVVVPRYFEPLVLVRTERGCRLIEEGS